MGLKITVCMHSWDRFWTKDWKRPESPTATFEEPGAKLGVRGKTGCREQRQSTEHAPCTRHYLRGGQTTYVTLQSDPLDTPLSSPHFRIASRPLGEQGSLLFVLSPSAAEGAAMKSRRNLLSGLWSIPVDQGGQEPWPVTEGHWSHWVGPILMTSS